MKHRSEIFLFEELPPEIRARMLEEQKHKVSYTQEKEDKDRAHKRRLKEGVVKPHHSFENIWSEMAGEGGIDLGDGWARIFVLNRFNLLQVYCDTRLEEKWLAPLSKEVVEWRRMAKWPRGNLPKSNPWREPYFHKVVLAVPTWDEVEQQFYISFDGPIYREDPFESPARKARRQKKRRQGRHSRKKYASLTFYFGREIIKDQYHKGLWTPKRQRQGRPWIIGDPTIKAEKKRVKDFFQPDEYDLKILRGVREGKHSLLEAKTHLIRRHRREKPSLVPLDVKETVEFWLRAMGLEDYSKASK